MPPTTSPSRPSHGTTIGVGPAFAGWALAWIGGLVASAVIIWSLGTLTIDGYDPDDPTPIPLLFAGMLGAWTAFGATLWWLSRHHGTGRPLDDYRVRWRWSDAGGLVAGVLAQFAVVPLVYVPLRWGWPDTFTREALEERARDLVDRATGPGAVLLVVMVVIGAPLVEEFVYRGLLQSSLATHVGRVVSVVGVAAFFALIHFQPVELPGLFAAGLVFGSCFAATGRLGTAIAAHVGFNAAGLIIAW